MKILLILFFFATSLLSAQTKSIKNLLELKSQIKVSEISSHSLLLQDESLEKKSPGLAIIYSMLLPGMGELYAGSYESGMYFTIADGIAWGVFIGFDVYGNWQRNNYKAFAESRGGVDLDGKDEKYFATIGDYINIKQYNREQELNRDFNKVYNVNKFNWSWVSTEVRREYRGMWSSSENAFNNVRFAAGALVLNRIISAINAVRLVTAHNKKVSEKLSWRVSFGISNNINLPASLKMNFQTSF